MAGRERAGGRNGGGGGKLALLLQFLQKNTKYQVWLQLQVRCSQKRGCGSKGARDGMGWDGIVRHGLAWYGMGCHGMAWNGMQGMVRYGVVSCTYSIV